MRIVYSKIQFNPWFPSRICSSDQSSSGFSLSCFPSSEFQKIQTGENIELEGTWENNRSPDKRVIDPTSPLNSVLLNHWYEKSIFEERMHEMYGDKAIQLT